MYLFGVKYCYNLDRLQIACCHLVFVKKSPSFQNVDIFPELDRCTPCVFIGTVARFSRNKSLLISFGAPVLKLGETERISVTFAFGFFGHSHCTDSLLFNLFFSDAILH